MAARRTGERHRVTIRAETLSLKMGNKCDARHIFNKNSVETMFWRRRSSNWMPFKPRAHKGARSFCIDEVGTEMKKGPDLRPALLMQARCSAPEV